MGEEEVGVIGMNDDKDDGVDVDVDVDDDKNSKQMVAYYKTFNLIDIGNGVESRYTMANGNGDSKTHGWTPKLSFRLFNMTLNNSYRIYTCLHKYHHQQKRR